MEHSMIMKLIKEAYLEGLTIEDSEYENLCDEIQQDKPTNNVNEKIFERSIAKDKIEYLLRTKYEELEDV